MAKDFLLDLEVVPSAQSAITLYCDNRERLQMQRNQGATREESTLRGGTISFVR